MLQPNSERVDVQIGNEQETLNGIYDRIANEKKAVNDAYNTKLRTINETITGFGSTLGAFGLPSSSVQPRKPQMFLLFS